MKLIHLEEVEKLWRLNHTPELMVVHPEGQYISLNNIYYLPTIDPIATIDEMIDEIDTDNETLRFLYREKLKELKSRLSPHHSSHD